MSDLSKTATSEDLDEALKSLKKIALIGLRVCGEVGWRGGWVQDTVVGKNRMQFCVHWPATTQTVINRW